MFEPGVGKGVCARGDHGWERRQAGGWILRKIILAFFSPSKLRENFSCGQTTKPSSSLPESRPFHHQPESVPLSQQIQTITSHCSDEMRAVSDDDEQPPTQLKTNLQPASTLNAMTVLRSSFNPVDFGLSPTDEFIFASSRIR